MKTSLMDGHQVGVCTGGAQISIGHDKLVVEFPVSGARESLFSCFQFQDIPGKGCFYIFIPTAWSSIHGSGDTTLVVVLSKHRVLDSFIFDVHCGFHQFNILHACIQYIDI